MIQSVTRRKTNQLNIPGTDTMAELTDKAKTTFCVYKVRWKHEHIEKT